MPFNIGPGELILILVIALVVLGPGKLPDVASSLGKSVREFRKAATDVSEAGKLDSTATTPAESTSTAASASAPASASTPAPTSSAPVDAVVDGASPRSEATDETAATAGTAAAPARDPNAS